MKSRASPRPNRISLGSQLDIEFANNIILCEELSGIDANLNDFQHIVVFFACSNNIKMRMSH